MRSPKVPLVIREAAASDAGAVGGLLAELGHPLEAEAVRANLTRLAGAGPEYGTFVAESGGSVVGIVTAFATPVVHRPRPSGRISVLVVAASHAGRGIGSALLARAEQFLAGRGCDRLELTSAARREAAHAFYRRRGYEQQGLRFTKEPPPLR
jgi:GNAT superfamily N-acetyltransferase